MTNEMVRKLGLEHLSTTNLRNDSIDKWRTWLSDYRLSNKSPEADKYVWLTCVLALKAVSAGNFGVGCILVDNAGNVIVQGHNKVFYPYFRSDQHAEMVVLNIFEETHQNDTGLGGYTLFTSLESCPMCLARLITSGISKISYAAPDMDGGMVHRMKLLPPVWIELAKLQLFDQAKCSKSLINAAQEIFLLNADELNQILERRRAFR
jgi:tRNA(Arg) A34 adenosine deaminase TadA